MSSTKVSIEEAFQGRRLLSLENQDALRELERAVALFSATRTAFHDNKRIDMPVNGLSSEMAIRTPVLLYDLPELMQVCNTAFTDGSRVFFSVALFRDLMRLRGEGKIDFDFVLKHELEHIRLLHTSRMLPFDRDLANRAQDIRINIDILTDMSSCRLFFAARSRREYEGALDQIAAHYEQTCTECAGDVIHMGLATRPEDRQEWGDATSEQIARILQTQEPPILEIDMSELFKKAAEDLREAADRTEKNQGSAPGQSAKQESGASHSDQGKPKDGSAGQGAQGHDPQEMRDLADALDRAAQGSASRDDLEKIRRDAGKQASSNAMREMDGKCDGNKDARPSSLDDLKPSKRVQLSAAAADHLLNPQAGKQAGKGKGKGQVQSMSVNAQNLNSPSENHYIPPEDLKEIFERANAQNLSKALGYDTPEKIEKMRRDTADNTENAVRKAASDMQKAGGSYPGAHMVNCAMRDLDLSKKPVLEVTQVIQKVLSQQAGRRKTSYDIMTPSIITSVRAADMGFGSSGDIPYMGTHVPVKPKKNLVVGIIDTSGSTGAILERLAVEAVNIAKRNRHDTAPEVMLVSADTVVRGKPVMINERNVEKLIKGGLSASGLGGTDFLAPLLGVVKATEKGGVLAGRKIDHILYFTDGECWLPPRDALPEKLPPVLFLVPDTHYRQQFDKEVKDSSWSDVVFFPESQVTKLDLEKTARRISSRRP